MAVSPFIAAINQIVDEKSIPREKVLETIEAAVAAAYRRDYGKPSQIIRAKLDEETGQFTPYQVFEVIETEEEIEDPQRQKIINEAQEINKKAEIGGEVTIKLPVHEDFGRIAAQTAKQVIIQRLREAERDVIYSEFKEKENHLLTGNVQQIEGENVIVSLGKANAVILPREKIPGERFRIGQRVRVFIKEVAETNRGPQIIATRVDERFILELFAIEVPEIPAGSVEIKSIAREPGSRTKVAVTAHQESLDPVGSCVGQKGTRVQAVLNEIGDEKIDIILWDTNVEQFVKNALSPAKVHRVEISKNQARVYVDESQTSLAIGKNGQNVRLASKLTGLMINIKEEIIAEESTITEEPSQEVSGKKTETKKPTKKKKRSKISTGTDEANL